MSYFITGTTLLTDYFNTVGATANDVTPRNINNRPVTIASIEVTEVSGGTPNLTIACYDPINAITYYKRNLGAMTARQTIVYDEPFVLIKGWELRVTVSAGTCSVIVNYFSPNATGVRA
jgi:hypothetical protein